MFCTQCGTQIPDGSKFCTGCGAKMEAAPVAPVVTPEPVKEETIETPAVEKTIAPVVEETVAPVVEETVAPVVEETSAKEETSATMEEAVVPTPTVEKKNFCTNCGKELPEGTKFCTGCGAKVGETSAAPVAVSEPVKEVETPAPAVEETVTVVEEPAAPVETPATVVEETELPEKTTASVTEETPAVEPQVSLAVPPEKPVKKGKGGVVAIVIFLLLILAAGGVALWYFVLRDKPIDLFETALNEGRYDDAEDIHDELEDEDEEKADELMVAKLTSLFDKYSNGDFESFEEFEKEIDGIFKIASECDDIEEELKEAATKMMVFSESNENYKNAEEAYKVKNYDSAIRYYYAVYEKDPNYKKAQKSIVGLIESAISDADGMVNNADFYGAKFILEEIRSEISNSEDENYKKLNEKIQEIEEAEANAEKESFYNGLSILIDNKNYDAALIDIKNAISNGDTSTKIEELHREAANGYVNERVELVATGADITGNYRDVLEALVIAKDDGNDEYVTEAAADKISEYMQRFIDDINELVAVKDLKNAIIYLEYLDNFVDNESVDIAIDTYKNLCTIYDWTELSHVTAGETFNVASSIPFESGSTFETVYELELSANTANNYAGIVFSGLGGSVQSLHMTLGTFPVLEELVPGTVTIDILANNVSIYHVEGVRFGSKDLQIDLPLGVDCDQVIVKFTLDTPADGGYTIIKPCIGKFVFSSVDLTTTQVPLFSLEGFQGGTESTPEIMPEGNPDENPDVQTPDVPGEENVENPDASVENPDASVENPDLVINVFPSMEVSAETAAECSAIILPKSAYTIPERGTTIDAIIQEGNIAKGDRAYLLRHDGENEVFTLVSVSYMEKNGEEINVALKDTELSLTLDGISVEEVSNYSYLVCK